MHYHYGQNIPGYLPMADEPNICSSWEGARDALADDIDRAADDAAGMYQAGDDDGSLMASYEGALQEVRDWPAGQDIYVNVCSDDPHDLGVSYWVTACREDDCITEDDA